MSPHARSRNLRVARKRRRGRPPEPDAKSEMLWFRCSPVLADAFRKRAARMGTTHSGVLRNLVERFLSIPE
jgi:hypothetical protein